MPGQFISGKTYSLNLTYIATKTHPGPGKLLTSHNFVSRPLNNNANTCTPARRTSFDLSDVNTILIHENT